VRGFALPANQQASWVQQASRRTFARSSLRLRRATYPSGEGCHLSLRNPLRIGLGGRTRQIPAIGAARSLCRAGSIAMPKRL